MREKPPILPTESVPTHFSTESLEKMSPRLLKSSFYLTKIAHALLPKHVPDIEEVIEGQQIFKREGVIYQVPENDGDDVEDKDAEDKKGTAGIEDEIITISNKLEQLGLTRRVDAHYRSYAGEGKGNMRYIKTFVPWEVVGLAPGKPDLLLDEKTLRAGIRRRKTLSAETKKVCEEYLDRILELFEEEKVEQEKVWKESLRDCTEEIKEIEDTLAVYESSGILDALFAITTEEQAVQSEPRKTAINDRNLIDKKLKTLRAETNVAEGQYEKLYARYKTLQFAIGARNGGVVDHTR